MKPFKGLLSKKLENVLEPDVLRLLPSGFQRLGHIVVLNLNPELLSRRKEIGRAAKDVTGCRTVCVCGQVRGELREPELEWVCGERNLEVVVKESGCIFKFDSSKVMFSKGNLSERRRLVKQVKPGETVVDMFSGIGYFSIPIAKFSRAGRIIAIERNPVSVKYLKENIRLNRISNIEVVEGDCREVSEQMRGIADRVLMGYLPGTKEFLPSTFSFLKDKGVIHYHDVFYQGDLWEGPRKLLEEAAGQCGCRLESVLEQKKVKAFAPKRYHVVVDAVFSKI